jgi:hypothetical protein
MKRKVNELKERLRVVDQRRLSNNLEMIDEVVDLISKSHRNIGHIIQFHRG